MPLYSNFELFSLSHCATLIAIFCIGLMLCLVCHRYPSQQLEIHLSIAAILSFNVIWSFIYRIHHGVALLHGLPLHFSDITIFVVLITLFTRQQWSFELSYYWGFSGSALALLTPDLKESFPYIPALQYFVSHGLVVVSVMIFLWAERRKPRPGSFLKAFLIMNACAIFAGVFDKLFRANYFFF